jgi:hypothetical protein
MIQCQKQKPEYLYGNEKYRCRNDAELIVENKYYCSNCVDNMLKINRKLVYKRINNVPIDFYNKEH